MSDFKSSSTERTSALSEKDKEKISAYVDSELSEREDRKIQQLIQSNPVAAEYYEQLQSFRLVAREEHRELLARASANKENLWSKIEADITAIEQGNFSSMLRKRVSELFESLSYFKDPQIAFASAAFAVVLLSVLIKPSVDIESISRGEIDSRLALVKPSAVAIGRPNIQVVRLPRVEERIKTHGFEVAWIRSDRNIEVLPVASTSPVVDEYRSGRHRAEVDENFKQHSKATVAIEGTALDELPILWVSRHR